MKKDEKHEPNFNSPMLGVTWYTSKMCKDCIFRDKDPYTDEDGKITDCAWSRSSCRIFEYPAMKPDEVYDGECEYYEKEKKRPQ